jgi:phosphoribosylformylglycinamidine cyclo-ligase
MVDKSITYKRSGVDVSANTRWVHRIQSAMKSTHSPRVLSVPGAFTGLFRLFDSANRPDKYADPVLVGCADGVGTKVLLGIRTNRLRGLGIDLVAMNVNDLITCGATPLFFLDYLAVHRLVPDQLADIMDGIADGCRQAGCALLGGETAEMPDLYRSGDLDLAGFSVGIVDRKRILDGKHVKPGDVIVGLPSSGIHSNGYSLVRKLITSRRLRLDKRYDELDGTLADALLAPTRIYVNPVLALLEEFARRRVVTALAHITGGGLRENVARALPTGCYATIDTAAWSPPPIFPFMQSRGVARREMFNVFNMGIGFVIIVRPRHARRVVEFLTANAEQPIIIGQVAAGKRRVVLK